MNLQNLSESPNIVDMTGFPMTNQELLAQTRQFATVESFDAVEVFLWLTVGMWAMFIIVMVLVALVDLYFTNERLSRWRSKLNRLPDEK